MKLTTDSKHYDNHNRYFKSITDTGESDSELVKIFETDKKANDILFKRYNALVLHKAYAIFRKYPFCDFDELYQEGVMGLIHAFKGFDGQNKLSTFATPCVFGYCMNVVKATSEKNKVETTSLDYSMGGGEEDGEFATLGDTMQSANDVSNEYDVSASKELLDSLIANSSEVDSQVISEYFLKSKTYREIAEVRDISVARASQLVQNALYRIKRKMSSIGLVFSDIFSVIDEGVSGNAIYCMKD